jgi:hypothetical protein
MVFTGSPVETGWIHRMVYFPEEEAYELVPEFLFPRFIEGVRPRISRSTSVYPYCGIAVQALRAESRSREIVGVECEDDRRGVSAGNMGVRVISITRFGEAFWFSVKRDSEDDEHIGVDEIIL